LLLEGLLHTLGSKNIQVYTGNMLPVNDGAISFGQAVAGGLQHLAKKRPLPLPRKGPDTPHKISLKMILI
jgi:hypothetical protein